MSESQNSGGRELATSRVSEGGATEGAPAGAGEKGLAVVGQPELESLPQDQRKAMESLIVGGTVVDAAKAGGVSRGTIYNWLKRDPVFQAAYNQWHEVMKESCRSRVMMMLDKAASAVEKALEKGDFRPAMQLLIKTGMVGPQKEKSTDAEEIAREAALQKKRRRARLWKDEMEADIG
jgi:hypothetical protein